jgi:hypothetical protein
MGNCYKKDNSSFFLFFHKKLRKFKDVFLGIFFYIFLSKFLSKIRIQAHFRANVETANIHDFYS